MDRRALPTETAIYSEPELAFAFFFFLALGFFGRALRFSALILRRKLLLPSSNACRRQLLANLRVLLEGVDKLLGLQAMKTLEKAITRTMNRNKQKVSDHASWRTNLTSLVVGVLPELSKAVSPLRAFAMPVELSLIILMSSFWHSRPSRSAHTFVQVPCASPAARTHAGMNWPTFVSSGMMISKPLPLDAEGRECMSSACCFRFFWGKEPECVIWKMDYGD